MDANPYGGAGVLEAEGAVASPGDHYGALADYREVWRRKAVLRTVYSDLYRRVVGACRSGPILEVGGGSGNFKEFHTDMLTLDIQVAPWVDIVADAQKLPFSQASFDNIVLFDVLHHIPRPVRFLDEAVRILRPGGRLVMMEPGITPVSFVFYRWFHAEPVVLGADPLMEQPSEGRRYPFDANQAIPTLLFGRHRKRLSRRFPELRVTECRYLSLFAYPLSGGFQPWSLIPDAAAVPMLGLEKVLEPLLGRVMGFRLFAVLERR